MTTTFKNITCHCGTPVHQFSFLNCNTNRINNDEFSFRRWTSTGTKPEKLPWNSGGTSSVQDETVQPSLDELKPSWLKRFTNLYEVKTTRKRLFVPIYVCLVLLLRLPRRSLFSCLCVFVCVYGTARGWAGQEFLTASPAPYRYCLSHCDTFIGFHCLQRQIVASIKKIDVTIFNMHNSYVLNFLFICFIYSVVQNLVKSLQIVFIYLYGGPCMEPPHTHTHGK